MRKPQLAIAILAAMAWAGFDLSHGIRIGRGVLAAEPDPNVLGECDFDSRDAIIKVHAVAGMERCRFGLATSASSLLSAAFSKKLDRLPALLDVSEKPDLPVLRSSPLTSIGGVKAEFPGGCVICSNLTHRFGGYWSHVDGAIGLEVLAQHIVQIDFDDGKVRFLRAVPEAVGERLDIVSLQKRPRRCAVTVKAQCCGEPAEEFYVELEDPDAIQIRAVDYRRLLEKGMIRRVHHESTFGLSGFLWLGCYAGTAASFSIGDFRTKDVRAISGGDNVIGLGYLSRFVVTFDFPRGFMYLRPGKQFEREDRHDISGLNLGWSNDSLVVRGIERASPAEAAGLLEDDVILDVDGKPVNRESRATIWRQLRQQGSTLHLRVKRAGDDSVTADLKLETVSDAAAEEVPESHKSPIYIPNFPSRPQPHNLQELIEPDEPENT